MQLQHMTKWSFWRHKIPYHQLSVLCFVQTRKKWLDGYISRQKEISGSRKFSDFLHLFEIFRHVLKEIAGKSVDFPKYWAKTATKRQIFGWLLLVFYVCMIPALLYLNKTFNGMSWIQISSMIKTRAFSNHITAIF